MATAAASAGFLVRESVQAAAALDSVRVAATAFWDLPGALAAGSSGAGAAADLLDATFFQGMGKPAAAATDLLDAPNSECMKKFFGSPAIVLGDTGGVSNSICMRTLTAVACAHSRLEKCGVGSCVGVGVGACAGVSCVVSSCVVDDVDDACKDGSVLDVIRAGSISVIQSFSEYHDSSCARLNALQNSHLECGRHVCGRNEAFKYRFLVQGQAVSWEKNVLFHSSSQEKCMKRRGQAFYRNRA